MSRSNRNSDSTAEDIPLPPLRDPKEHDFAQLRTNPQHPPDVDRDELFNATLTTDNTDSDSGTESDATFNWEEEDDSQSTRGHLETKAKRGRWIWHAFMKLSRPVRTFIVAIVGSGILITPLIVFQVRFAHTPGHVQAHVWSLWLAITWAVGCATYLVIDLAPRVVLGIFRLFSHKVERMQITVELTTAVLGWLKLAMDVSAAWIALSVICAVYHPSGRYWVIINRVMQALFSASILLLAEKIFLQYVAINFHRRALADRIAENQLGLRALDRLSNATPYASRRGNPFRNGHKRGHRAAASMADPRRASAMLDSEQVSGANSPTGEKRDDLRLDTIAKEAKKQRAKERKRKRRPARVAAVIVDNLGGALGQVALKNSKFNNGGGTLFSASRLARKLFSSLHGDENLTVEDFYPYFTSETDAKVAFDVFDKDGNGDISKREMRDAVRRIYRERRALTASLKDVGSAVAKLDAVLISVALVILAFICLLIFNRTNTIASLVPLATIILGFSFVFGHSAQTLFESLIFIFSTHVFDVGDLIMIDDSPMFVMEFGLFSTTFKRVDGQTVIAPNALLASAKTVHNLRRSSSMWETTNLMVSYDTPLEVLESLRKRLEEYISEEKNRREWSSVTLHIEKMEYQNAIHLIVGMEHRPNWQDWGGRWARRTDFMRYLKTCLEELDLRYTMPVQPVLMPNPPYPGIDLHSPTDGSSPMRRPSFRLPTRTSRDTLAPGDSLENLGRSRSSRDNQFSRSRSHRSSRPGGDRF